MRSSASSPCASWGGRSRPRPRSGLQAPARVSLLRGLRSIQEELGEVEAGEGEGGEGGTGGGPVAELRRKLEEAGLPEEASREAKRELDRIAGMPPSSPQYGMTLTYLEWMASLPWKETEGRAIDSMRARQVLDEDHYDHEKVKDAS
jgi:ATP-dependent Lon protease